MNNNRNQNNSRRRGRGNRNQGGGGGGHQSNRIDSRARGNAPQMLDKYKKLAQDAQHNGDRVQAEYYLQFADHYFRVIADNRTRQDEPRGEQRPDARGGRRDERDQDDFDIDDGGEGEDRQRFDNRDRDVREREPRDREREGRDRDSRDGRRERFRRDEPADEPVVVEGSEGPSFEPDENPFTREAREPREPREERPKRRPARARRSEGEDSAIDVAALPPAFSANDSGDPAVAEGVAEEAPRPRRKRSGGGTLSAVG